VTRRPVMFAQKPRSTRSSAQLTCVLAILIHIPDLNAFDVCRQNNRRELMVRCTDWSISLPAGWLAGRRVNVNFRYATAA
jgi:hypothetical protein